MVSVVVPNTLPEVTHKDNLEQSIIKVAAFAAGFLEIILNFHKCQNAPFLVFFMGMIN